jgi:hypothetical protein
VSLGAASGTVPSECINVNLIVSLTLFGYASPYLDLHLSPSLHSSPDRLHFLRFTLDIT